MSRKISKKANDFSERLVIAREASGIKQYKLAKKLKVAVSTLSNWENGERFPDADRIIEIIDLLHCDPGWLMSGRESAPDEDELAQARNAKLIKKKEPVSDIMPVPKLIEEPEMLREFINTQIKLIARLEQENIDLKARVAVLEGLLPPDLPRG